MTAEAWSGRLEFGDSWAVFIGAVGDQDLHGHVAVQLALGLRSPVVVRLEAGEIEADAVLLAPLARHCLRPSADPCLLLYADPRGALGRGLWARCSQAAAAAPDLAACLRPRLRAPARPEALVAALLDAMGRGDTAADARLARLVASPDEDTDGGPRIRRLAAASGLSGSGFRELAHRRLGAPPAQYALWRKLERALRAATDGESLAAAAAAGGFADQAHMARTLRRMFGVTFTELGPLRSAQGH